jgi:hypothetical protein
VREALGCYLFVEVEKLDAAIEPAARIPASRLVVQWRGAVRLPARQGRERVERNEQPSR